MIITLSLQRSLLDSPECDSRQFGQGTFLRFLRVILRESWATATGSVGAGPFFRSACRNRWKRFAPWCAGARKKCALLHRRRWVPAVTAYQMGLGSVSCKLLKRPA